MLCRSGSGDALAKIRKRADRGRWLDGQGRDVSLRQDFQEANRRYLLAIDILYQPRTVVAGLAPGWRAERDGLHGLDIRDPAQIRLALPEIYLREPTK